MADKKIFQKVDEIDLETLIDITQAIHEKKTFTCGHES